MRIAVIWRLAATGIAVALLGCESRVQDAVPAVAQPAAPAQLTVVSDVVDGDVVIARNAVVMDGHLKTVKGKIRVGEGARVKDCASVYGSVTVADDAETGSITTVKGDLQLARNAKVTGDIKLVNGHVFLHEGSQVYGDVRTVTGGIEAYGATVNGVVENYGGGILITAGSLIKGDVRVRQPTAMPAGEPPRVVIGRDSRVLGALEFERTVVLYVHDSAEVAGDITGAEPIRFSGDLPEGG